MNRPYESICMFLECDRLFDLSAVGFEHRHSKRAKISATVFFSLLKGGLGGSKFSSTLSKPFPLPLNQAPLLPVPDSNPLPINHE
jgi:hypothetical protein